MGGLDPELSSDALVSTDFSDGLPYQGHRHLKHTKEEKQKGLMEVRKPDCWKGKGKWLAHDCLSIRRARGIVIGSSRKSVSEEQRTSKLNSVALEFARSDEDALVGFDSQPLACWVHVEKKAKISKEEKKKKKSCRRDRKHKDKLSVEAQWGTDAMLDSKAEEAGHPLPPIAQ